MDIVTKELDAIAKDVAALKIPVAKGLEKPVSFADGTALDGPRVLLKCAGNRVLVPGKRKKAKQVRTAVLFSGGPASGGHNVVLGLSRFIKELYGVRGGPAGLLEGELFRIKDIDALANTGGFDLLGTDRTKIRTEEQVALARAVLRGHGIGALVVIGGDDSNTNAAYLAEHLHDDGIQVISVPKTMDGDLSFGQLLPVPFGFDTATRIYAELVGNICRDSVSSRKYWHFVRLMGRDTSHVTLEVALRTQPAVTLISEEIARTGQPLHDIVEGIVHAIKERRAHGIRHGVVLVPEGLLEAIPEVRSLLAELGARMAKHGRAVRRKSLVKRVAFLARKMSKQNGRLFLSLPPEIQQMLTLDRDAHGNLNVSQIPTEQMLSRLVVQRMPDVAVNTHFFGYEGRCGVPSPFDAMLGYNLGLTAASLVLDGRTGYMAALTDLDAGGKPLALPLGALLVQEERNGAREWVIGKTPVKLDDPAFAYYAMHRMTWARHDPAHFPEPRQLWGPHAKTMPFTVALNQGYRSARFR